MDILNARYVPPDPDLAEIERRRADMRAATDALNAEIARVEGEVS